MIQLLLPVALADPPVEGLDAWQPAEPVALPPWFKGSVWVRDGAECRSAAVEDVAHGWLAVPTCTGDRDLRCDLLVGLRHGWEDRGGRCRRGVVGAEATLPPSVHEPVALVSVDDAALAFAAIVTLEASYGQVARLRQSCTPESLAALDRAAKKAGARDPEDRAAKLADQGIVDRQRTCDLSTGLRVHSGLGPTAISETVDPAPVDCRTPCPPNPTSGELEALRTRLVGRQWFSATAVERRIFPTADGCRSAPDTRPLLATDDLCATLGATVP